ncbi:MAG: glycosyltransferase family 87 protein [Terracidiphilus sp.]
MTAVTTAARKDGFYLMLLGTAAFLLLGVVLMNFNRVPLLDFRTAYYSGECLLRHCDPYNQADITRLYAQRVGRWPVSERNLPVITRNIYPPSAFAFTLPLALLPFDVAQVLWCLLIAGSFILAAFLIGSMAANDAPLVAGGLVGFCLANSGSVIYFGNPAGFVVPLCVIAVWCFVRERVIFAGIACLAASLAFKPHDSGFVWLFFLLAGGVYRQRALQTLAVFAAFSLPAAFWVTHISPHWPSAIASTLHLFNGRGGMNDPSAGHGALVLTNLQTVTSFFWPDPHTYDLASYVICAPLFLFWGFITLRSRPSTTTVWLGLATIAAFSMLPVYHRQYDAKLILLAVPACAQLWARRGATGWIALLVTTAAFVLNGDLPWVAFLAFVHHMHWSPAGRVLTAVWDFPVPLSLLAMGVFYLWIYARYAFSVQPREGAEEAKTSPFHSAAV